jgi:hypothetical protein
VREPSRAPCTGCIRYILRWACVGGGIDDISMHGRGHACLGADTAAIEEVVIGTECRRRVGNGQPRVLLERTCYERRVKNARGDTDVART